MRLLLPFAHFNQIFIHEIPLRGLQLLCSSFIDTNAPLAGLLFYLEYSC